MCAERFEAAFHDELGQIAARRRGHGRHPQLEPPPRQPEQSDVDYERLLQGFALTEGLFGVSLSGGGIRSASFNLGILQQLADYGLIRHVDYLSTVSGGGYIGAWLAAWLKREGHVEPDAVLNNVERQLVPSRVRQATARRQGLTRYTAVDQEPEPIHHLRRYTRYLAPRIGFFSADSWTLIAIYVRNVLLNQTFLFFVALAAVLFSRCFVWFFALAGDQWMRWASPTAAAFFLTVASVAITKGLLKRRGTPASLSDSELRSHIFVFLPLLITAILISWSYSSGLTTLRQGMPLDAGELRIPASQHVDWFRPDNDSIGRAATERIPWRAALTLSCVFALIYGAVNLLAALARIREIGWNAARSVIGGISSGALVGFLIFLVLGMVVWPQLGRPASPSVIVTLAPPLFLLVFMVGSFAEVGILGPIFSEPEREYWSRVGAWTLIYAATWLGVFGLTLGGQYAFYVALDYFRSHAGTLAWGSVAAWFLTSGLGSLAGKSRATLAPGVGNQLLEAFAQFVPYVFVAGLAVLVSVAATELMRPGAWDPGSPLVAQIWNVTNVAGLGLTWLVAISALSIAVLVACVDANLFSLHAMYANRLVRCYLGASRHKSTDFRGGAPTAVRGLARLDDPVAGVDASDDLPLRALTIGRSDKVLSRPLRPGDVDTTYWGPFLLINTALNVVSGSELAWQDRKAVPFVLTPIHCGSQTTGYAKMTADADVHLTLGRAMAISGAAASPNMGYHSSPGLTSLMAVFNMRLGWWMQNPRYNWSGALGGRLARARGYGCSKSSSA